MTDANTGTAVGDEGTILRQRRGGDVGGAESAAPPNILNGVSMTDENTGTAVGDFRSSVRTTNGGATSVAQESGTTNSARWCLDDQ